MTLIIGLPTKDGLVLGSDGQITTGEVRSTGIKIWKLNSQCVWSASGELALIQRVKEKIQVMSNLDQPLQNLRDSLALVIKESVEQLLRLDFRTQFFNTNPAALLGLHPGDFIFGEFRDGKARSLHIMANGTAEWVDERPVSSGSGALFAYALLQKYEGLELDLGKGSLLVFKVIEEAIKVGAYGLGEPIHIWHATKDGIYELSEEELQGLRNTAATVRNQEINLFRSKEATKSSANKEDLDITVDSVLKSPSRER